MWQADEPHQLYRIQRDMMKDSAWKRFDDYNLNKGGLQFSLENKSCLAQCYVADFAQSGSFGYSAYMQKPVNLQLSADEFITHYVDDRLGKEFFPKNFSRGITVSDVDNLNLSLSLSIGQSKGKDYKRSERNKCCASSSEVIDLEDPNFGFSKNNTSHELPPRFAAKSFSKHKHELERFLQIGMNHCSYGSPARESVSGFSPRCQRPTSYSGHSGHHKDFPSTNLFSKKPKNLDLNMVQFEYSSCMSNNFSAVRNPSRTTFSGVTENVHWKHAITSASTSWNKANVIDLSDTSDKHRQIDLNIDLTNSRVENNEGGWNNNKGGICVIDLDSDSGEPCSSNKSNPKIESVDSSSKIDCVDAEPREQNKVGDKQNSYDNTESNIQYINNKKLQGDEMVQKAAESLVKIHSETRVCTQHGLAKECLSLDSYERMVLGEKESEADDICVSSNAFVVVGESDNKASRYKLKRGTRMKDFRKDVLPSLAVLSRSEISEDINVMEGVIRSREYKKMRAKMGDNGESFRAGRSKRSRAGYNRRYDR